jgi:hypothetical protein
MSEHYAEEDLARYWRQRERDLQRALKLLSEACLYLEPMGGTRKERKWCRDVLKLVSEVTYVKGK